MRTGSLEVPRGALLVWLVALFFFIFIFFSGCGALTGIPAELYTCFSISDLPLRFQGVVGPCEALKKLPNLHVCQLFAILGVVWRGLFQDVKSRPE